MGIVKMQIEKMGIKKLGEENLGGGRLQDRSDSRSGNRGDGIRRDLAPIYYIYSFLAVCCKCHRTG